MFFCIDSAELLIKRSITGIAMLASAIKLPSAEKKSFNNLKSKIVFYLKNLNNTISYKHLFKILLKNFKNMNK